MAMFNGKVRSFFMKKPRLVDGCCEEEPVCCDPWDPYDQCEFRTYYTTYQNSELSEQIIFAHNDTINLGSFIPGDELNVWLHAIQSNISITSVTAVGDNWITVGLLPYTVNQGDSFRYARVVEFEEPGNYEYTLNIMTSCGPRNVTFQYEIVNDAWCKYDVSWSLWEGNVGDLMLDTAVETVSITNPFTVNIVGNLTALENYTLQIAVQPIAGSGGTTISSVVFAGALTELTDVSPINIPVGNTDVVGTADMDTSAPGAFSGTVTLGSICYPSEITFNYNVIAP